MLTTLTILACSEVPHITTEENAFLNMYADQDARGTYSSTYYEAYRLLSLADKDSRKPFCPVAHMIRAIESGNAIPKDSKPLTHFIEQAYGQNFYVMCGLVPPEPAASTIIEVKHVEVPIGKIEEDLKRLELYDQLYEASNNCKRARNKLMDLTHLNKAITMEDYQMIMSEVKRCKAYKIEKDIQEGK